MLRPSPNHGRLRLPNEDDDDDMDTHSGISDRFVPPGLAVLVVSPPRGVRCCQTSCMTNSLCVVTNIGYLTVSYCYTPSAACHAHMSACFPVCVTSFPIIIKRHVLDPVPYVQGTWQQRTKLYDELTYQYIVLG